ncbi:TRAP transporter small permease [Microvirga pudoricolor]|uniref:TRAP transporter small permease n=1 Tax=Microvirga pudoricolor TaxID=2778729 RepID=UPI00194E7585|nr:TRAP transporter small permease [Microvirga pudoricolor]
MLSAYCKGIEMITIALLGLMVVLVFGNVVLRYLFNSGITETEELSRWMFVWVTFLGSVVALYRRGHLGTEFLVGRLGVRGRKACLAIGYGLMLLVCWLLFDGALEQTRLNWDVTAPSSGLSLGWFYSAGVAFSVSAAAILGTELVRLLTGRADEGDLIIIQESEDRA